MHFFKWSQCIFNKLADFHFFKAQSDIFTSIWCSNNSHHQRLISRKKLLSYYHCPPPSDIADTYRPNPKLFKSIPIDFSGG